MQIHLNFHRWYYVWFLNTNCLRAIKPNVKGYSWYTDQILSKKEQQYPYKAVSIEIIPTQ